MTIFNSGPCEPWEPIFTCPLPTGAEAVSGVAIQAATEILWKKTNQRFGVCSQILRPCARDCFDNMFPNGIIPFSLRYPYPYNYRGTWFNLGCGGCPGSCSCTIVHETVLPAPVAQIVEIKVDGVVLTAGMDYRVDDQRLLVRLDGNPWPQCNDLNKDDTEVGTWSVHAQFGEVVPDLGRLAVGELASELMKFMLCDETCAFPTNPQSIQRQGVSMSFFDPDRILGQDRIGLYFCDLFITTWNPANIQRPARAYDVNGRTFRRVNT
jgi:hypothetical protein